MSDKQRTRIYGPAFRTRHDLMGLRFINGDASGEGAGGGDDASKGGKPEYTPPATQADLDRIIADRVSRERAKYADYDDVKAKAAKHDEHVAAQQTETEQAIARAEAAEQKLAGYEKRDEVAAWANEIVKDSHVPASALRGSTREELEAHFTELSSLIKPTVEPKPADKASYFIADEGGKPAIGKDDNVTPGLGSLRAAYAQTT